MKRSLTTAAAAVLTGAGVVGSAGAAAAAPEFPAELPVDNGLAQTVFHGAGTLHGVQKTVGEVVHAPSALAEQAAQQAGQQRTGGPQQNPISEVVDGLPLGHTQPVPTRGIHAPLPGLTERSAPAPRDLGDVVNSAGGAVADMIGKLPPEAVNSNVQSDNGQAGKPGMNGQNGQNGEPGGSSSAVNLPTTKPAPAQAAPAQKTPAQQAPAEQDKRPYLLDLSNAGGALGKPVADTVAQTPLAPLVNLQGQG